MTMLISIWILLGAGLSKIRGREREEFRDSATRWKNAKAAARSITGAAAWKRNS
jgi:hypothetical protein